MTTQTLAPQPTVDPFTASVRQHRHTRQINKPGDPLHPLLTWMMGKNPYCVRDYSVHAVGAVRQLLQTHTAAELLAADPETLIVGGSASWRKTKKRGLKTFQAWWLAGRPDTWE